MSKMKVCKKCEQEWNPEEKGRCPHCKSILAKAGYQANREKELARGRAQRAAVVRLPVVEAELETVKLENKKLRARIAELEKSRR